jgi:hypothetical protein
MTWWPEDPYQECDLGYSSGNAPQNMARARISSGRSPCYKGSPHRGLLRSVKNFQSFTVICRKPHVASSICLRAKIFQNPEETLWTHCRWKNNFQWANVNICALISSVGCLDYSFGLRHTFTVTALRNSTRVRRYSVKHGQINYTYHQFSKLTVYRV